MRWLACLALLAFCRPVSSQARDFAELGGEESASSFNLPVYVDVYGSWGSLSKADGGASSATTMQFGGGLTVAGVIEDTVLIGATADYRSVSQISDVDGDVGNLRGSRLNPVSPMLGLAFSSVIVKADYQFSGSYALANRTARGESVSFGGASGIRVQALYGLSHSFYAGLGYETVSFSTKTVGSVTSDLATRLTLWQAALVAAIVF